MKAIFIPTLFDPEMELKKLNDELRNYHTVLWTNEVNKMDCLPGRLSGPAGYILIIDE